VTSAPTQVFNGNIFAPAQGTLAYSDTLLGIAIPFLPLRALGVSPIGQLNIAVLLGLTLSAVAAYWLGRVVSGSRVVGVLTLAAFCFGPSASPFTFQLDMAMRAGVPAAGALVWVLLDRAADPERRVWPWATSLVAVLAWEASVSIKPALYAYVV